MLQKHGYVVKGEDAFGGRLGVEKKQDQTISKPYLLYVYIVYHLVISHSHGKSKITMLLIGKPSINGAFSMAMLNNQMVYMVTICHNGLMWFMYGDS